MVAEKEANNSSAVHYAAAAVSAANFYYVMQLPEAYLCIIVLQHLAYDDMAFPVFFSQNSCCVPRQLPVGHSSFLLLCPQNSKAPDLVCTKPDPTHFAANWLISTALLVTITISVSGASVKKKHKISPLPLWILCTKHMPVARSTSSSMAAERWTASMRLSRDVRRARTGGPSCKSRHTQPNWIKQASAGASISRLQTDIIPVRVYTVHTAHAGC